MNPVKQGKVFRVVSVVVFETNTDVCGITIIDVRILKLGRAATQRMRTTAETV